MAHYKPERDREKGRQQMARWRERGNNREAEKERKRLWRQQPNVVARENERQRTYRVNNPDRFRQYKETYLAKVWAEAIAVYGDHCVCCGETERAFLTFDHINGGGRKERMALGIRTSMLYALRKLNFPTTLQMLCWNCNAAKSYDGSCPHKHALLRLVK
jgi:hypothetical protein